MYAVLMWFCHVSVYLSFAMQTMCEPMHHHMTHDIQQMTAMSNLEPGNVDDNQTWLARRSRPFWLAKPRNIHAGDRLKTVERANVL